MGEEHVKSDIAAAGVRFATSVAHEFGYNADYGSIQFEQAAFVQEHRHSRRGHGFGERSNVEESCGRDFEFVLISEMAKRFQGGQFAGLRHRNRRRGKSAGRDCIAQNRER